VSGGALNSTHLLTHPWFAV